MIRGVIKICELGRARPSEAFRHFGKRDKRLLGGLEAYLSIENPKSPPTLKIRCGDFLAGIELQAVQSILGGRTTVQCIECPRWFEIGAGARRSQSKFCSIRCKDNDLELGTLRMVESLEQTKTGIRFKAPKSGRHRAITLPAYAVQELRRLKREQAQGLLALGVRQSGQTLLCCQADGEPHQPLSLTYEFARFMGRLSDLPRLRFHDLRHSHATQLLASGVHPKIASERLGHASVAITLDLYSHVTDTMQSEAAVKLDSAMQVAKSRLANEK